MSEEFTDAEIKQLHKFVDSGIVSEASRINSWFNIPELTEDELKQIKMPENVKVPKHVHCRCSLLEKKI